MGQRTKQFRDLILLLQKVSFMNSSKHAAAASHIAALAFLCVGFWGADSINAPVWAGTAVYAGTFVMKLNITIKSALAANQSILCDASLNSIDASTGY